MSFLILFKSSKETLRTLSDSSGFPHEGAMMWLNFLVDLLELDETKWECLGPTSLTVIKCLYVIVFLSFP